MKIFSSQQIREWDQYTIHHTPIPSIELMEIAARKCFEWISKNVPRNNIFIFCGRGNNGGDGLAIGRMLIKTGRDVQIFVLENSDEGSADFIHNLKITEPLTVVHYLQSVSDLPLISKDDLVVDAMFGSGLNRPLEGIAELASNYINAASATVISVDMPSGLFADRSSKGNTIVRATYTLTFQQFKLAMLLPENAVFTGTAIVLDISLHNRFYTDTDSNYQLIDQSIIQQIYQPRKAFSHKGDYGHALVIAGSYGMIGAAVLCNKAVLRSGAGKVTAAIPECGYEIMQGAVCEAMCSVHGKKYIRDINIDNTYSAVGIGPGLGRHGSNKNLLKQLFTSFSKPIVIDADALNELADAPELLNFIPEYSILTPHPKEFGKLFGRSANDFDQLALAISKAVHYKLYIVLKGHHTFIAGPDGKGYFNSTGNAGMATGGSGDVLTGIITGLLAQNYVSEKAAVLGVYLHGLAGDLAAAAHSQESLIAGDIINHLGKAFLCISNI